MMSDFQDYIQKGIRSAEQGTTEDRAHNYVAAAQHYIDTVDWLMEAVKYGGKENPQMIEALQPRIDNYLKRANEIKEILENGSSKTKAVADTANERRNSKDNQGDDTEPDTKRMMQKFEKAIVTDSNVTFADVVGLEQAKEALKEAIILPAKFPQLFQSKRKLQGGILLYGPPSTGKSYLARSIASECKSTFISVSSADLHAKLLDESEKGVKCLFQLAHDRQPCIIFIDGIDALFGQPNDTESESLRRAKTEFLIQMQVVNTDNLDVLVLATTNIPWALDRSVQKRFDRFIYTPLPGIDERAEMFKKHLGMSIYHTINDQEWKMLGERSEHYSGADIALVCREALLRPIQRLNSATHFRRVQNPKSEGARELWLACSPGAPDAEELTLDRIKPEELCELPVTRNDMLVALATQNPTIDQANLAKHQKFFESSYEYLLRN